jgi:hypothetical protein
VPEIDIPSHTSIIFRDVCVVAYVVRTGSQQRQRMISQSAEAQSDRVD